MAESSYTTLRRGLVILDALSTETAIAAGGMTVSELAAQIGTDRSQVSRALAVLAEHGYVLRDSNSRKYRMGWRLFLAARRATASLLVEEVQAALEELVSEFGQRGYMVALEDQRALTILDLKPRPSLHESLVGQRMPLHFTASGRALVMHESLESLIKRMGEGPLERPTENAPKDIAELHERLVKAREDGYVIVDEEMEFGLVSVAVPLKTDHNGMHSSISLVGTAAKFRPSLEEAGRQLLNRTQRLQEKLENPLG